MSDNSWIIAAVDISAEEAPERAKIVREWLIAEGIVEREISDSVLGGDGGHSPGRNYAAAVKPEWVQKVQAGNYSFPRLRTNGVAFITGRTVFDAGGNGIELQCRFCGSVFVPDESWSDAAGLWYDGDDRVRFPCPSCVERTLLTEWGSPWPWAFGNLGVEFWNWPPLSETFIRAVSEKLGRRTVVVRLHL